MVLSYCCPLNLMDQKRQGKISLKDRIILAIKELLKKTLRFVIVNVILKLLII